MCSKIWATAVTSGSATRRTNPAARAALRLGFTFEGIFRQHMVAKDRNRDTAWFSMLDHEWPARKRAFETWLNPANFDKRGNQLRSLVEIAAAKA